MGVGIIVGYVGVRALEGGITRHRRNTQRRLHGQAADVSPTSNDPAPSWIDILLSLIVPLWGIVVGLVAMAEQQRKRGRMMVALSFAIACLAICCRIDDLATGRGEGGAQVASSGSPTGDDWHRKMTRPE